MGQEKCIRVWATTRWLIQTSIDKGGPGQADIHVIDILFSMWPAKFTMNQMCIFFCAARVLPEQQLILVELQRCDLIGLPLLQGLEKTHCEELLLSLIKSCLG